MKLLAAIFAYVASITGAIDGCIALACVIQNDIANATYFQTSAILMFVLAQTANQWLERFDR